MPKFIYTFVILFLISALVLARTIIGTSPQQSLSLFIFFFSLFLATLGFFASLLSLIFLPKDLDITNQRLTFRKIFRVALTVALLIMTTGVLKVLGALNTLNLVLLILLAAVYAFFIYK